MTPAEFAHAYTDRFGFAVLPLPPKSKVPEGKDWPNKAIKDPEKARTYWTQHPSANLGVVLAASNLCSLDIDSEYAKEVLGHFGIDVDALIAAHPTVRGKPGRCKIEFTLPDDIPLPYHELNWPRKDDPSKSFAIFELRAGDRQDVFPPSIHPDTGKPYEWITKPTSVSDSNRFPRIPGNLVAFWLRWKENLPKMRAMCPWSTPPADAIKATRDYGPDHQSPIEAFIAAHDLRTMLERYGYKREGDRFKSPHSEGDSTSVVMLSDDKCYIHSASDPLCSPGSGKPVNAFDLFCQYEHGGDVRAAVKTAASLLGIAPAAGPRVSSTWVQPVNKDAPEPSMAAEDWPAPLDLFRKATLPPLLKEYCPPEFVDYIWDQSGLMGNEPDILAICTLVAASACLHDRIKLQPKMKDDEWLESGRLWGAFVGDPSIKKSPTMKKAVGYLQEIDINLGNDGEKARARYLEEMEEYKRAVKASAKTGHGPGEKPQEPPKPRLIIEDFTTEAMGALLKDNERGMFAQFDELGLFFGQMDAYRSAGQGPGKDKSLWLQAYNGGPWRVDRKGEGSVFVPNWSMRVLGGIQPSAIQAIASKLPEDGLLQRFIVIMAQSSGKEDEDRVPDRAAKARYRKILHAIFAMQPASDPVMFSQEAHEIRLAFETERKLMIKQASLPRGVTVALGKWDGLFCRLALVHHAIYCADTSQHPVSVPISAAIARRVSAYLMEYLLFHGVVFYGEVLNGNDRAEHAKWIAGWLADKPEMVSVGSRDITRAYSKWGSLPEWVQRDTMRILEDSSWVTPAKMTGKRTTQWHVNPKASATFADIGAAIARERLMRREALLKAAECRRGIEQ